MASWFNRIAPKLIPGDKSKISVPAGVWIKCDQCNIALYSKDLEKKLKVCPSCNYHFRLTSEERIESLMDRGTFVQTDADLTAKDPLKFSDSKKYKDRLKTAISKTKLKEAITTGTGKMKGRCIAIAVFNFRFMGGSMGSVVGEKITRIAEIALKQKIPLLIVSASGGARMQEGIYSLMQMAKTSAVLAKLKQASIPYISLLTDPTTGGVSASFAMLGDIIIGEPGALIGFAGPRVIQQTIGGDLPEGFQTSEFLLKQGMIDMVVNREELKDTIYQLFDYMLPGDERNCLPQPNK